MSDQFDGLDASEKDEGKATKWRSNPATKLDPPPAHGDPLEVQRSIDDAKIVAGVGATNGLTGVESDMS